MNHLTFIRDVKSDVVYQSREQWRSSNELWMAEFDMSTIPPTIANMESQREWRFVVSDDWIKKWPKDAPRLYIDTSGNIVDSANDKTVMQGPSK